MLSQCADFSLRFICLLGSFDSHLTKLRAKRVDLFGQKQIVQLVLAHILLAHCCHCFFESRVGDLVLFDLLVSFHGLVHSLVLVLV